MGGNWTGSGKVAASILAENPLYRHLHDTLSRKKSKEIIKDNTVITKRNIFN